MLQVQVSIGEGSWSFQIRAYSLSSSSASASSHSRRMPCAQYPAIHPVVFACRLNEHTLRSSFIQPDFLPRRQSFADYETIWHEWDTAPVRVCVSVIHRPNEIKNRHVEESPSFVLPVLPVISSRFEKLENQHSQTHATSFFLGRQ